MSTGNPVPPVPPQPPQNAPAVDPTTVPAITTTIPPATAAEAVSTLKSDLHQAAENARNEFWQISATARLDVHRLLADIEALHGVSLAGLKKVLGI